MRSRWALPGGRGGWLALAVAVVAAACGPGSTDPGETVAEASSSTVASLASQPPTSPPASPPTAEPPPDPVAGHDLGDLSRCDDVPELEAGVDGTLDRFANPDEEVVGVLLTYAQEHPDTYAGFWIDREHGGTLVMAFTDRPGPHLDALLGRGPSPDDVETVSPRPPIGDHRPLGQRDDVALDVVQADFSEAELMAAADEFWADRPPYVLSGGISTTRNRLSIDLIDPTAEQLDDLAGRLNPAMACVTVMITPTPPSGPLDVLPRGDTELTCGGGPRFPATALDERAPAAAVDHDAARALLAFLADPPPRSAIDDIEQRPPTDGWFVLAIDESAAVFGHGDRSPYTVAFLDRENDAWELDGWTIRCVPTVPLPEGLGRVRVTLDPDRPRPQPTDTTIHLHVTEQACASGRAMGDRLRGPQVEESADQVLIAFAVESEFVPATCPANPPQPVTVELDAPLGTRAIRDGLSHPPSDIDLPDG